MAKSTRNSGLDWSDADKQGLDRLAKENTPTESSGSSSGAARMPSAPRPSGRGCPSNR